MRKALVFTLIVALLAVVGVSAQEDETEEFTPGEIVARILERGELICGGNQAVQGFGFLNEAGEYVGFDIDFCRAVAAAILGDANAVSVRPLTGAERQAAMQSGEIDMMSRNTTFTLSRDATWGAVFGPTTFYDGQGVMTRAEYGVSSIAELDGTAMCVQAGTTTELNIGDYVSANGLDIEILTFPDANSTWDAYLSGRCESWTTDKSGLASFRLQAENPSDHVILPETLSKEPLGPLSPSGDEQFAEIVRWVVYGMITAEEYGITSENIDSFLDSEDPNIQRLLGLGDNASGSYLGINNQFMVDVIRQVGNYGEVYERNLAPLGLDREGSLNALWTEGGLLYAPPFR
ncbi:MAG: amino acid ABC transporter substrate-binding protein [Phototrophicales bacterium]|nr:MAG: amino acid ABC transporter substrate-binding protein [Phototrophicales bacterium]RMG77689.1 MAG: amino acid ABC transporter substrate-binding protein [Chloroflexota bacterium]